MSVHRMPDVIDVTPVPPLRALARFVRALALLYETSYAPGQGPFALSVARPWPLVERRTPFLPRGLSLKWCYGNATRLARGTVRLKGFAGPFTYVEGYAMQVTLGVPLEHAWVVNSAGVVHDATWGGEDEAVYVGVAVATASLPRMTRTAHPRVLGRLLADVDVAKQWHS